MGYLIADVLTVVGSVVGGLVGVTTLVTVGVRIYRHPASPRPLGGASGQSAA